MTRLTYILFFTATGAKATSEKNSFSCGVVPEAPGTNVSISNLEKKYPKRKKKETALTKHRKWLQELQNTKDRLESQYEEELLASQAKNQKVRKVLYVYNMILMLDALLYPVSRKGSWCAPSFQIDTHKARV